MKFNTLKTQRMMACTMVAGLLCAAPMMTRAQTNNEFQGDYTGTNITSSATQNAAYGDYSGYTLYSGDDNVFVGFRAGFGEVDESGGSTPAFWTITEDNTNSGNTAVGSYAGFKVDGINSSYIGFEAGYNNQASYNTFVGARSGYYTTTGTYNTFMGYKAGQSTDTGRDNTFIGRYSGASISTGSDNTVVGATAMGTGGSSISQQSNAAYCNTVMGSEAGYDIGNPITGSDNSWNNSCFGAFAGDDVGGGRANTLIGAHTGTNTEHADYNTFIGAFSGWDNNRTNNTNDASRNTYVGIAAGEYNREGSDNVIIGALADIRTWDGVSDSDLEDAFDGNSWQDFDRPALSGSYDGGSSADVNRMVLIGSYARSGRNDTVTIGYSADSTEQKTITIGTEAQGTHSEAIVIGYQAASHGNKIAVIGSSNTTSIDPNADATTALGSASYRYTNVNAQAYNVLADAATAATIDFQSDAGTSDDDHWRIEAADSGNFTIQSLASGVYTPVLTISNNGNVTIPGEISVNSDARLKQNVEPISNGIETVGKLQPKTYEWKDYLQKAAGRHPGLIAQEVEAIVPEIVSEDADGIKSVSYQELVPYLIAAVNELSEQNKAQQAIIDELQAQAKTATELEVQLAEVKILLQDQKDMMRRMGREED